MHWLMDKNKVWVLYPTFDNLVIGAFWELHTALDKAFEYAYEEMHMVAQINAETKATLKAEFVAQQWTESNRHEHGYLRQYPDGSYGLRIFERSLELDLIEVG